MSISAQWTRRIQAAIAGIGLGLALHMIANWWSIYLHHVPQCGAKNCVADFVAIYAQAMMIWENPSALYDLDQQFVYQKRVAPIDRALVSPYPPIAIVLHAPLALSSISSGFLAMTALNVLLLCAVLRRLTKALDFSRDQTQWLLLFTLCNFGVHAALSNGQSSMIVLYFLTAHLLAFEHGREIRAGVWVGMLCVKPQYLALPHFILLLHRKKLSFIAGVLLALFLTGSAFLLLGTQSLLQYLQIIRFFGTENSWINPLEAMHNLKALTGVWLPAPWNNRVWLGSAALVFLAVVWLNLRAQHLPNGFEICWICNAIALLLLTPHLFTHDLSLLIVPCALFLSLFKNHVPIWAGLGVVTIATLPAVNYLLPTIMAATLVILFALSLMLVRAKLATTAPPR
jgi:hypothetical protein